MRYIQFKVDDNSAIFRIKSDSDNLKNYLPKEISNRIVSLVDVMNEYEKYREILKNSKEKILLKTLGSFGGSLTSFTLAYLIGSTPVDNDEVLGQFIATIGLGALGTGLGYKGVKEISTLSEYDKVHQKYNDSIENLNNELYEKIEDLTERGYFVQTAFFV